jgi:hypothetical protein
MILESLKEMVSLQRVKEAEVSGSGMGYRDRENLGDRSERVSVGCVIFRYIYIQDLHLPSPTFILLYT